ncbi:MAG: glycosyltransferase family 39 protein [Chloroflexota bacterium]
MAKQSSHLPPQRYSTIGSWLVLLLLSIFLLTYSGLFDVTDGKAMFAVSANIVKHLSPDGSQLRSWEDLEVGHDGLAYAKYPLGPSLAMLPFYGIGLLSGGRIGLVHITLLLPILATAFTSLIILKTGQALGYSAKTAALTGLLYGIGTMAWYYTRDLFAEPLTNLAMVSAFYFALRYSQTRQRPWLIYCALSLGVVILTKTVYVLIVPIFLIYLFYTQLRSLKHPPWLNLILFAGITGTSVLIILAYNWLRFADPLHIGYTDETFSTPLWIGAGGQLFSLQKGLFFFNPILLLSLPAIKRFWQQNRPELILILALFTFHLVTFGMWWSWIGGRSWGPRFLAPIVPLCLLFVLPVLETRSRRWLTLSFIGLSILVQLISLLSILPYRRRWTEEDIFDQWYVRENWTLENWPFFTHLRYFDPVQFHLSWLWQTEAGHVHFDIVLLGMLIVTTLITGFGFFRAQFNQPFIPVSLGVGIVIGMVFFLLTRTASDTRYVAKMADPLDYQPAYDALLTQLPADSIWLVASRHLEPYLLNRKADSSRWYTLNNRNDQQQLDTVSKLLGRQGGEVVLIMDEVNSSSLPYAIEQWLAQHGTQMGRQTFDDKVQATIFQLPDQFPVTDTIASHPSFDYTLKFRRNNLHTQLAPLGWNIALAENCQLDFTIFVAYSSHVPAQDLFLRLVTAGGELLSEGLAQYQENGIMTGQMLTASGTINMADVTLVQPLRWQLGAYQRDDETQEMIFDVPGDLAVFSPYQLNLSARQTTANLNLLQLQSLQVDDSQLNLTSEFSIMTHWHPNTAYTDIVDQFPIKRFVHLRDGTQTVLQLDQPLFGQLADPQFYQGKLGIQDQWIAAHQRGSTLEDRATFLLSDDFPSGRYQMYLGLYDPETLGRYPIVDDISGENAIFLGELDITNKFAGCQ